MARRKDDIRYNKITKHFNWWNGYVWKKIKPSTTASMNAAAAIKAGFDNLGDYARHLTEVAKTKAAEADADRARKALAQQRMAQSQIPDRTQAFGSRLGAPPPKTSQAPADAPPAAQPPTAPTPPPAPVAPPATPPTQGPTVPARGPSKPPLKGQTMTTIHTCPECQCSVPIHEPEVCDVLETGLRAWASQAATIPIAGGSITAEVEMNRGVAFDTLWLSATDLSTGENVPQLVTLNGRPNLNTTALDVGKTPGASLRMFETFCARRGIDIGQIIAKKDDTISLPLLGPASVAGIRVDVLVTQYGKCRREDLQNY